MRLKGKVALITGVAGPHGIAFASAKRMGEEGALLAIADISDEVYERARELEALGYKVLPLKLDLRKFEETKKMGTFEQFLSEAGFTKDESDTLILRKELIGFTPIEVLV